MFIFWKGKTMVDYRDDNAKYGNEETNRENGYGENKYGENGHNGCGSNCGCECCQCKRIFMMLVVLILVFIAGIMVGNCGRCRYADNYYYGPMFARHHNNMSKPKKFHRGMQEIAPTADNIAAKKTPGKTARCQTSGISGRSGIPKRPDVSEWTDLPEWTALSRKSGLSGRANWRIYHRSRPRILIPHHTFAGRKICLFFYTL